MKRRLIRIIIAVLLFVAVIKGWWFVVLPVGIAGTWFFGFYAELIIAGIAYDALFGVISGMGMWQYAGTIVSCVTFVITLFLKKVIRHSSQY